MNACDSASDEFEEADHSDCYYCRMGDSAYRTDSCQEDDDQCSAD